MRKLMAVAAVAACVAAWATGRAFAAHQAQTETPPRVCTYVERAFAATGAAYSGFEIHDWTTLSNTFGAEAALRARAGQVARRLGGTGLHFYGHVDPRDHVALITGTYGRQDHLSVELDSMRLASPQTVLVVRIWQQGSASPKAVTFTRLPGMYADVALAVRSIGGRPMVNASLFGHLARLAPPRERARIIRRAFGAAAATPLQSMVLPYTTSVAGFSAAGLPYIVGGRQKLNLQVAMHEDYFNHYTRVLVGSPILTVEY